MTSVFIVHGNDYDDESIRDVHATYRDALTVLDVPVIGANSYDTISEWAIGGGRVNRPTRDGFHVYATRQDTQRPWSFRVQVGSVEFDAEDDPIAHRVMPHSVHVWALDRDAAGKLAFALMEADNERMAAAELDRVEQARARREAEKALRNRR